MAMNFFEHQEKARRSTGRLVILFSLAVAGIVAILYFFFAALLQDQYRGSFWQPMTLLYVMGGTFLTSGLACLVRISSLSAGGSAVAEMVGGVKVVRGTDDLALQKYVNVVEEMAIASGVPVPDIYIMEDESNINAFAAGYSIDDAAVAVTRGCIERLDRDELQGVVAHEFSHILNGDMRLNIRLIGVLAGILFLATIGYVLMRIGGGIARHGGRGKEKGGALAVAAGFFFAGLAIMVIGYLGHFFGSLIKAAVSRQREFLADASAVQFTRDPDGIGGALRKIGGYADGAIENPKASEISHMCFTSTISGWFSFATHPPLPERISRIESLPIEKIGPAPAVAGAPLAAGVSALAGTAGKTRRKRRGKRTVETRPEDVVASTGTVSPAAIRKATRTIARLPAELLEAARHPYSVTLLAYLLLLPEKKKDRRKMIRTGMSGILEKDTLGDMFIIEKSMRHLDPHARLPLLEMAAPALRLLSKSQAGDFLERIEEIIKADNKVDLREFCFVTIIEYCLYGGGRQRRRSRKRYRKIADVAPDISRVLAALAEAGQDDSPGRLRAFAAARENLAGEIKLEYEPGDGDVVKLRRSVGRLACSTLRIRKAMLEACCHCALADGVIEVAEAELLRAFAHAIGVPVPPFLASTDLESPDGA